MRRWSKEPRRISGVEGSAAASLARALTTVSCFIYNNETKGIGLVNPFRNIYFNFVLAGTEGQSDRPDHKPDETANRTIRFAGFVGLAFASPCTADLRP